MNPKRWLHEHSLKLLAIRDTPEAIAGGVAIGVFFGFAPLLGLKTVLAILVAWLTRSNILAAVLAGAAHDVLWPFMPAIYLWEYEVGYWLLSHPHRFPHKLPQIPLEGLSLRAWLAFLCGVGKPLLVGGLLCSAPFAPLAYVLTKRLVARHHRRKQLQDAAASGKEHGPA
jgi:uncharacterized protein (DUF2062 family)